MTNSPANFDEFIRGVASRIGATEAAAFAVKQRFFSRRLIDPLLHVRSDNADAVTRGAAMVAFKELVSPCIRQARDGAIEIKGTNNGQDRQYCLVTLARRDSMVLGAAAFIVRCRDEQDARIVLMRVASGS